MMNNGDEFNKAWDEFNKAWDEFINYFGGLKIGNYNVGIAAIVIIAIPVLLIMIALIFIAFAVDITCKRLLPIILMALAAYWLWFELCGLDIFWGCEFFGRF